MAELTSGRSAVLLHQYPLRMAVVERALRELGLEIVAKTGRVESAFTALQEHEPDLLVVELDTRGEPDESLELLRRASEDLPGVRILAFSAHPDSRWIDGALEAGATAYITDTPNSQELTTAVHQAVAWAFNDASLRTALVGEGTSTQP